MNAIALASLLGDRSCSDFFDHVWGRGPTLVEGAIVERVESLLTLADLDVGLRSLYRADDGWLHLAAGGKLRLPADMLDADGMVRLGRLADAISLGYSLYLTKAELLFPSLRLFVEQISSDLFDAGVLTRERVGAHVFVSPPGAQAFDPHRDEHDSLVVQLHGTKSWIVHGAAAHPGRPGPASPEDIDGPAHLSAELHPGDVLYVPAGWVHEARTSGSASMHVTVRIFPMRWRDLIARALEGVGPLDAALDPWEHKGDVAGSARSMIDSDAFRSALERVLSSPSADVRAAESIADALGG